MQELVAEYPNDNGLTGVTVVSLKDDVASDLRPTVLALGARLVSCCWWRAPMWRIWLWRSPTGARRNWGSESFWGPPAAA